MRCRHRLEPRLGPGIIGVKIGVRGAHKFAVGFLDVRRRGRPGQAKGCIGVDAHLILNAANSVNNAEIRLRRFDADQSRPAKLTCIKDNERCGRSLLR